MVSNAKAKADGAWFLNLLKWQMMSCWMAAKSKKSSVWLWDLDLLKYKTLIFWLATVWIKFVIADCVLRIVSSVSSTKVVNLKQFG